MVVYNTNGIEVRGNEVASLRNYIREQINAVKAGSITQDEFIDCIESCFEEGFLLSLENAVVIRAVPESK